LAVTLRIIWHRILRVIWHNEDLSINAETGSKSEAMKPDSALRDSPGVRPLPKLRFFVSRQWTPVTLIRQILETPHQSSLSRFCDIGHADLPVIAFTNLDRYCLALRSSDTRIRYRAYVLADRVHLNKVVDHLDTYIVVNQPLIPN
jgi:hypothetical protein